jgi:hypothetical protein
MRSKTMKSGMDQLRWITTVFTRINLLRARHGRPAVGIDAVASAWLKRYAYTWRARHA